MKRESEVFQTQNLSFEDRLRIESKKFAKKKGIQNTEEFYNRVLGDFNQRKKEADEDIKKNPNSLTTPIKKTIKEIQKSINTTYYTSNYMDLVELDVAHFVRGMESAKGWKEDVMYWFRHKENGKLVMSKDAYKNNRFQSLMSQLNYIGTYTGTYTDSNGRKVRKTGMTFVDYNGVTRVIVYTNSTDEVWSEPVE